MAFQNNAFQGSAFQITRSAPPSGFGAGAFASASFSIAAFSTAAFLFDVVGGTVGGGFVADWRTEWQNEQYRKKKERERIKQDEIIRLKLEAQEATLAKKDAEQTPPSKQRDKQIKAALKLIAQLNYEIDVETHKLSVINRELMIYSHNMAMVAIIAANPFMGVSLTNT